MLLPQPPIPLDKGERGAKFREFLREHVLDQFSRKRNYRTSRGLSSRPKSQISKRSCTKQKSLVQACLKTNLLCFEHKNSERI